MNTSHALDRFIDHDTVVLTTYKRDGSPVGTPVHLVVDGDHAYFRTYDHAWKARRLRRNPEVEIAPATIRGEPIGPALHATTRQLGGQEATVAAQALSRQHPILHRWLIPWYHRLRRWRTIHYRLDPAPDLPLATGETMKT